jgi:gamma-glutamyltranspeptidase/glutathione hydrolase
MASPVRATDMVNLAGVAPIIVYLAEEQRVVTLSGLGRWPQAASVAYFQQHCGGRIPQGVLRCITPAAPDAWITALEAYGTMSLAEVMSAALSLARDGFPMHPFIPLTCARAALFGQWPRVPRPSLEGVLQNLVRSCAKIWPAPCSVCSTPRPARPHGRQAGLAGGP